jgi:hypothetical protein
VNAVLAGLVQAMPVLPVLVLAVRVLAVPVLAGPVASRLAMAIPARRRRLLEAARTVADSAVAPRRSRFAAPAPVRAR